MKRLAAKASLQRPYEDQILTPHQLFTWTRNNILGIRAIWVPKNAIDTTKLLLAERYKHAVPIKNTRKYHYFKPTSKHALQVGLTSFSKLKEIIISRENLSA